MAGSVIPNNFCFLIKPSGPDCNLRCKYCFYTSTDSQFGGGTHRMSEDILETLVRKMLELRLPQSTFCWQGGEPTLMGVDWFKKVIEFQKKYGQPGQSVSNAIQTNGILIDDDWASLFSEYNFLVGVSLDGPAEIHDAYRGEGRHEKVMNAIDVLGKHKVDFNILCVVNNLNQNCGSEIYKWFRDQGLDFLQFIPAVESDEQNNPCEFSPSSEGFGKFLCDVFDAWLADGGPGKVYVRFFETLLMRMVTGRAEGNCILSDRCGQYLVVEHNGDVFPCDFFVTPELKIGNIETSEIPMLLDSPKLKQFSLAKSQIAESCMSCEYMKLCNGGCLKDRQRMWGDYEATPSYLCQAYKIFFAHALGWFEKKADEIKKESCRQQEKLSRRTTITRRPGRNDSCPCGSGKKFKRCCGNR